MKLKFTFIMLVLIVASNLFAQVPITVSIQSTNLELGIATATTSGGTAPFTYSWSTSSSSGQSSETATGLTAGTYTVKVTDLKHVIATTTVTITPLAVKPFIADSIPPKLLGLYSWKTSVKMIECDINGNPMYDDKGNEIIVLSQPGQKFHVIGGSKTNAVIKYLYFTKRRRGRFLGKWNLDSIYGSSKEKRQKEIKPKPNFFTYNYNGSEADLAKTSPTAMNSFNFDGKQRYFMVSINLINSESNVDSSKIIKASLVAGALTLPFKYRPENMGDFTGSLNFGAAVGYMFQHQSWRKATYSIVGGYSIASITLDSSSINNVKMAHSLVSNNNFTAISFSAGLLVQYLQNNPVQVGFFVGCDNLNRLIDNEYSWKYQGKLWFSIGLGISIFNTQSATTANSTAVQTK